MATLSPCPGCAKEVSTTAFTCPNCGHQLRPAPSPVADAIPRIAKYGCGGIILVWVLIAVVIVLMVIAIIGILALQG